MPSDYLGVVTLVGQAKLAASVGGAPLVITDVALGDGNGAVITPIASMTALVHEVWRGSVTAGAIDPENATIWRFQTTLPEEAGPFVVREIGLFDAAGALIALARTPTLEKKTPAGGVGVSIEIDIIVPISASANVTVIIGDEDQVDIGRLLRVPFIAVEAILNAPPGGPTEGVIWLCGSAPTGAWVGKANQLAQWQGDIWVFGAAPERTIIGVKNGDYYERTSTGWRAAVMGVRYAVATGTANALIAALDPVPAALAAGLVMLVKTGVAANSGAATINVNTLGVKSIKRVTGDNLAAGDLPANCVALLVYDGTNFQLLSAIPSSAPPAATETVAGVSEFATSAETITGTDDTRSVHPKGLAALTSTTARRGLIRTGTQAEVLAGAVTDAAVTPETLAGLTSTTDRRGLVELATNPEALLGTDTSRAVTPAGVAAVIAALVNSAPGLLNTLDELAAALGDDPNFATTITNALALKAPSASPVFTGNPTGPTPAANDNDFSLATTAFVQQAAQSGAQVYGVDIGSADTLAVDLTPAPAALTAGLEVAVKVLADNTGATTLNVNGLGAKAVKVGGAALRPGTLRAGRVHQLVYEASNDNWELIGPDYSVLDRCATAWAVFSGSTGAILDGRGISSVTLPVAGRFRVFLETARPDAHYAVVATAFGRNVAVSIDDSVGAPQTTTDFYLWIQQANANVGSNGLTPTKVMVAVFG